jgi:hypothetical protein
LPTLSLFLNLFLGMALLIAACYGLRSVWVKAVSPKILGYLIAPAVAVHELSHALACLMFGARVHSIVLFRTDGSGEVKHGRPKVKHIGDVAIAMAPLFGGIACLVLLSVLLQTPLHKLDARTSGVQTNQLFFLWDLIELVGKDLYYGFSLEMFASWRTYVFLYFAMCFTLAMAPSPQDVKNGSVGMIVLFGIAILVHLLLDRIFKVSGDNSVYGFLQSVLLKLHIPFAVCAVSLILAMVIGLISRPFR